MFVRQNIPVIFITAPTSRYSIPVPVDHLIVFYFAADSETVIQLHKQYAQTLRQVVGGDGVYVLDLEAEMAAASDEMLLTWFNGDGIHLTEVGLQKIAESIAGVIEENNLVTAP